MPQPYVALRGSSRGKTLMRNLAEGGFASLVIGHPSGDATVYELISNGNQVALTVKRPGKETAVVWRDPISDDARGTA